MGARLAGIASLAIAGALVHCSLVVDTDGLSGGAGEGGAGASDALANGEGGSNLGDGSSDGALAPGALGPLWLAYGNSSGKVAIRTWTNGTWSAELAGPTIEGEAVRWVVAKETPTGSFLAVVTQGQDAARLQLFQRGADGLWKVGFSQPMPVSDRRAFDIEYETKTNGVVVAYGDASSHPKARRFAGGTWSNEVDIGAGGTLAPQWVELARSPISDEVALVYADDGNNLFTSYWDGANWQKPSFIEGNLTTIDWKCFDEAYESSTGKLVVGWGQTTKVPGGEMSSMRYVFRQPGAPLFGDKVDTANGTPPGSMVMVPEVGTKRIVVSYVEYNCNRGNEPCDDFGGMIWDGSKFDVTKIDPDTTTLYVDRPAVALTSVAWIGSTGEAMAAYHRTLDGAPGQLATSRFSGTWSDPRGAKAPPDEIQSRTNMQLASVPGAKVVAVVEDKTGTLWSKLYAETAGENGTWSDSLGAPIATALVPSGAMPFSITVP